MTNGKRRRMMLLLLALCLLLIVAVGFQLWQSLRQDKALDYERKFLTPTPTAVCPGDKFTFPIDIIIRQPDSISHIAESWCRVKDGICPDKYDAPDKDKPFVEPYEVHTQATRTVPDDMPPGDWQLRHCNETRASGLLDVTCYAVNVTVLDCE